MTKKWNFFIGMDVSKKTIDVYSNELKQHIKIANDSTGFKQLLKWFKTYNIDVTTTVIVLEHTGGYEFKLMQFCESKKIDYCRLPGLEIKNSMGMVRGKSDKVDAKRIAQYANEKQKTLTVSKPINTAILALKDSLNFRKKLVRENAGYKASMSERKAMYEVNKADFIITSLEQKLKANDKLIAKIETQIFALIKQDESLFVTYNLLTSIKGIGKINALMTIVYTENFTKFTDARRYGVYAGVIPFDHSSGTSINCRKRISHLANKDIKQELNQAAKAAMMHDEETSLYANRLLSNGKHYKIVLNNVKFKLILRMFAVVKKQTMFVDYYKKAA